RSDAGYDRGTVQPTSRARSRFVHLVGWRARRRSVSWPCPLLGLWRGSPPVSIGAIESRCTASHKPWYAVGASAASLFREIDRSRPTVLLDETDALFKANKEMAEAVRMVL